MWPFLRMRGIKLTKRGYKGGSIAKMLGPIRYSTQKTQFRGQIFKPKVVKWPFSAYVQY